MPSLTNHPDPEEPWVEDWLGRPRFQVYLDAAKDDRAAALELYAWNSALAAAILHDLAHLEVALRNTYDRAISSRWSSPEHWLYDPAGPLQKPLMRRRGRVLVDINKTARQKIRAARERNGYGAPPGKIIADLSFGVWRYMTSAAHEKTLWLPYIHHAYPPRTRRADVDEVVGRLNDLRNRAAHCEPMLRKPVMALMRDARSLATMLRPEIGAYISGHSSVDRIVEIRPLP